jgi:hypothetical protein
MLSAISDRAESEEVGGEVWKHDCSKRRLNRLTFEISNSQSKKDLHDAGVNNDTHIAPIATRPEASASLPN